MRKFKIQENKIMSNGFKFVLQTKTNSGSTANSFGNSKFELVWRWLKYGIINFKF